MIKIEYLFLNALLILLIAGCGSNKDEVKPKMMPISESVYASVLLEPDSIYKVFTSVSGIVEACFIKEGDRVKKDQQLVIVSNDVPELNVENARLALQLARENYKGSATLLDAIRDEIAIAEINLKQDSINFFRQKNLWDQNIGTAKEYDLRKSAYEVSAQKVQALKKEYSRTRVELANKLDQAENNMKSALAGAKDYTITSKLTGTVYEVNKEVGELVSPQEPLASIGSSKTFIIKMQVDEVDITRVAIGQEVILTLDAFQNELFEASVSDILPQKNQRTQTFMVEAIFKNPPTRLYAGLSGEANILIDSKEEAVVIPRAYLTSNKQVNTADGLVDVEPGLMNLDFVEIKAGLDTTTVILMPEE